MATTAKSAPKSETPEVQSETVQKDQADTPVEEVKPDLSVFNDNPLIRGMLDQYLSQRMEIVKFNEAVLDAEKQASEGIWTQTKLLREMKNLAQPEDANEKPNPEAKKLHSEYEKALDAVNRAKTIAAEWMAKTLSVEMVYEKPKPDETEVKRIQETVRLPAVEIGKNLNSIAAFAGSDAKVAIDKILAENPLPQVGRKGSLDLTSVGSSKPKYRVDVTAVKDGTVIFTGEDGKGFTKASLSAKKIHAKDEAPTPDDFRKMWETNGKKNTEVVFHGITYRLAGRN